ncbi:MAG: hypothetical protein APF84_17415 [Gracilibacter sp. BRH_c7a]|nr:MAG: hypothetical protein APF84_17415 [Gracilibacter sp. BRH_c7a]
MDKTFMNKYERIIDILTKITGIAANVVLFSTMMVVAISVLMRIFLNAPIPGLTDIVSMLNALAVAFAVSVTEKQRKHIRIDFVRQYLPSHIAKFIFVVVNSLAILVISVVTWRFFLYIFSAYGHGNATWIMKIPHWPVILCLFLGLVIFLLTAICNLLSDLNSWKGAE